MSSLVTERNDTPECIEQDDADGGRETEKNRCRERKTARKRERKENRPRAAEYVQVSSYARVLDPGTSVFRE